MNKEILIVEDVELSARLYRGLLEKNGYKVQIAIGGLEAHEMLVSKKVKPDLIVTDINMPGLDGFQLIALLKKEGLLSMPFIFVSAKTEIKEVEAGMNAGAAGYLLKPINSDLFIKKINSICRPAA